MVTAFVIQAAGQTNQGLRSNNEDRYAIDAERPVLVVVDGMGGGEAGERAAALAGELLPRQLVARLADHDQPEAAIQQAVTEANQAVVALSNSLGRGRRGYATVVLAFRHGDQVFFTWLGDCRAYHLTGGVMQQLTEDHDVRRALVRSGTLTEEQAAQARIRNSLTRFLGNADLPEQVEFRSFRPQPGDRLILATDGLWNLTEGDLGEACRTHPEPQTCADHLVGVALDRGSRDNVTCIVAAFAPVCVDPGWLNWNDGTVARLARAMNEEKDFERMPILADALEDAGCTDALLLDHCRSPGPHSRGCWLVDLLLGAK
jgi:serine/threonine protein phosphatase PrpC